YIGTKGIINIATKLGLKNIIPPLRCNIGAGGGITPAIIADMARKNNKKAIAVFNKISEYLAVGICGIINIFNPDMISFSGGISNNWDLIKKVFLRELIKRSFSTPLKHVKIIKSKNHKNLGAIGAALLSLEKRG
ncbi:unnamed protein product, partial [marine sediment metagenome]